MSVTISFCKFWFENDTLIQVRCCHLLGIWCVFIVDMLILSIFLFCMIRYMLIYISRYSDVFQFYIHIRFNNIVIKNVSCSFLLYIKFQKHQRQYLTKDSVVNTEFSLKVQRAMIMLSFILKCFIQFACTNLHAFQKEGGNF